MPMPPMPPMMMPMMPMMPMDPCGTGAGGQWGANTTGTTSTSTPNGACPNNNFGQPTSDYFNTPNFDFSIPSSSISDLFGDTNTNAGDYAKPKFAVSSSTGAATTFVGGQVFGLTGGISGDLRIFGTAVTAFVSNRDAQNNTQVSGFYGADAATQAAAVTVVAKMCKERPWATNFLSFIVPASFFDSICVLRGFQVGTPPPPKKISTSTGTSSKPVTPPKPYVPPKVDIWAVPDAVRSGFRTSIFWESRGVESCVVASADGSFSQTALSGHAPSAPLSSAMTFTITCQTATSTPVIGQVTVSMVQ